jgi:hypothetical protein
LLDPHTLSVNISIFFLTSSKFVNFFPLISSINSAVGVGHTLYGEYDKRNSSGLLVTTPYIESK